MIQTPNLGITVWNSQADPYSTEQLAENWYRVDQHNHTAGRGARIPTSGIEDGAITASKIAANTIDQFGLEDGAVITSKLADGSVTTSKVADGIITNPKLANGSVDPSKLANNAVTTPIINNGAVTAAKLAAGATLSQQLPYVKVHGTGTQSIANTTGITLTWDTEDYDPLGMHDTGSNTDRLVAPVSGIYMMNVNILWDTNVTGYREIFIENSGSFESSNLTQTAIPIDLDGTGLSQSMSGIIKLAINDHATVIVYQNSGGSRTLTKSSFSMDFVSGL